MKTIITSSLLILSVFFSVRPSAAAQKYDKDDVLVVLSKSGLNIREKADPRAQVLALAPCGALVTMGGAPAGALIMFEGIAGRWAKVTFHNVTGYAFDGFLSRLRAPEEGCESLEEYFNDQFKSAGKPVEKEEGGVGTVQKMTELAYSNGAGIRHQDTTYMNGDPGWTCSVYSLPGIERVEDGFLILRLLNYIDAKSVFPVRTGRAYTTKDGVTVTALPNKKNNEIESLELNYRKADFSFRDEKDYSLPRIVIRKEESGIVIEIDNMKR